MTTSTPERQPSAYIHGTAPEEQSRLSLLNDLLNSRCLTELAPQPGNRVLDVGSGLGQFTHRIAQAAGPAGLAVGVERSPEQLARARAITPALADFRQGDAYQLPLAEREWGTFHLVHARFLLEHLRDPLAAVRQMVRAARPGGRIVIEDDDHDVLRLHPEVPGFAPLWTAYLRAFDRLGNDPFVGRRLVGLLAAAGARPVRSTWIPWANCSGHPEFPALAENLIEVVRGARPAVVAEGLLGEAAFDRSIDELRVWSRLPDATLWYGICWAEGIAGV